ncbi:MAG: N-acetyltransferase, partial [Pseudomonadota bacterium]
MTVKVTPGFAEAHRPEVAALFWDAFKGKLTTPLGPKAKALKFIEPNLNRSFAFSACAPDGTT